MKTSLDVLRNAADALRANVPHYGGADGWRLADEIITSVLELEHLRVHGDEAGSKTQAANDVLAERLRQVEAEGWIPAHDDEHDKGEIARAAAAYAYAGQWSNSLDRANFVVADWGHDSRFTTTRLLWPWDWPSFKPTNPRRDLVKAGALILAEIERLDRAARPPSEVGVKVGVNDKPRIRRSITTGV